MVLLSLFLISALILVNEWLYNGIMQVLIPIAFIILLTVLLWNAKSLSLMFVAIVAGLLVLIVYAILPEYTSNQAVEKIRLEFEGISRITTVSNTPISEDTFNPFHSESYYTFEIVENEGTSYLLLMDPYSDNFMVKRDD